MLQIARKRGGLAGAVGAEQRGQAAFVEREVEAVQRLDLAVIGPQILDVEHRGHWSLLPEIGLDDIRVGLHLGRRSLGELAAEIQRDDVVGDRHHETHVMLDQQHGDVAVVADAADQVAEHVDFLVVEAAGGLVEQQDLRLGRQRARQLDALLGAERQPGHHGVRDVLEIEIVEDLVDASC